MFRLSFKAAVVAVSALAALGSVTEASAMPLPVTPAVSPAIAGDNMIQQVQWHHGGIYRHGWHGGGWHGGGWHRGGWHEGGWRGHGWRGGGWYNGYRGYDGYRRGYRYYNGYWFPLAAFGAGALIGGAVASEPRYVAPAPRAVGINPRHYSWCEQRYRSYRAFDNTFQPNHGPRRQCYSPFY